MNTKIESGLFPKVIKGFCITAFPVITSICVAPFFVNNIYKVAKSYNACQKIRKNIVGKELELIQYIQQRSN